MRNRAKDITSDIYADFIRQVEAYADMPEYKAAKVYLELIIADFGDEEITADPAECVRRIQSNLEKIVQKCGKNLTFNFGDEKRNIPIYEIIKEDQRGVLNPIRDLLASIKAFHRETYKYNYESLISSIDAADLDPGHPHYYFLQRIKYLKTDNVDDFLHEMRDLLQQASDIQLEPGQAYTLDGLRVADVLKVFADESLGEDSFKRTFEKSVANYLHSEQQKRDVRVASFYEDLVNSVKQSKSYNAALIDTEAAKYTKISLPFFYLLRENNLSLLDDLTRSERAQLEDEPINFIDCRPLIKLDMLQEEVREYLQKQPKIIQVAFASIIWSQEGKFGSEFDKKLGALVVALGDLAHIVKKNRLQKDKTDFLLMQVEKIKERRATVTSEAVRRLSLQEVVEAVASVKQQAEQLSELETKITQLEMISIAVDGVVPLKLKLYYKDQLHEVRNAYNDLDFSVDCQKQINELTEKCDEVLINIEMQLYDIEGWKQEAKKQLDYETVDKVVNEIITAVDACEWETVLIAFDKFENDILRILRENYPPHLKEKEGQQIEECEVLELLFEEYFGKQYDDEFVQKIGLLNDVLYQLKTTGDRDESEFDRISIDSAIRYESLLTRFAYLTRCTDNAANLQELNDQDMGRSIARAVRFKTFESNLVGEINKLPDESLLKTPAIEVLNQARALHQSTDPIDAPAQKELPRVLFDTADMLSGPTQGKAKCYSRKAANLQKRPWGKILGGAMLALAGVAVAALSIAAAVVTFGAAAPVTILGFTLGASIVGSGIAVASAAVGAGVATGGAALFAKGMKKKPLRKKMERLAGEAKAEVRRRRH